MLPRSQRLSGSQVHAILQGKNSVIQTPLFFVRLHDRRDTDPARFSVVVSKKIAKNAVTRNILRRRVYSAISHTRFPPGKDYIISVKQTASLQDYNSKLASFVGNNR